MRHTFSLRPAAAILLASALHGLIAAGLLLARQDPLPDDDTVIDVLLAPPLRRAPPPGPMRTKPTPSPTASARSIPSPPASPQTAPRRAADQGAWRVQEGDSAPKEGLRRTLRAGVGCRSADFLALTKAEQEACERKLAAGAQDGPTYAVVGPKLKKQFDGVFECPKDDVWCEYRIGKGPYPGLFAPRKKKNPEWD
ncbi:MAG: hypothetical protein KBC34_08775 [Phenylobacterium sp.]|nr:hypothetical protein [Phenylobacterium sp.]